MKKNIIFLIMCVFFISGYNNFSIAEEEKNPIIKVGMKWEEAERLLKKIKAKEVILQMAPPESPNGGYMQLINFQIGKEGLITIIYDKVEGENIIIDLSLETNRDKPKIYHESMNVKQIDLNNLNP